ncbi:endonuclease/exonuclease/phosphatase family protein [Streptomyces longwoodensis]|uniref:endonuclease/exonuclease/phosphatase family protein n=1 Tax=Streptomyces longwoodensis TaxID=68231 RepID=UPI0033F8E093
MARAPSGGAGAAAPGGSARHRHPGGPGPAARGRRVRSRAALRLARHRPRRRRGRVGGGLLRRRRLVPVGHGDFWLSDTPGRAGSNTWGGAHPRMVTWVRFQDRAAGGRPFCVLNTHLDDGSAYARARAAALITERVPGLAGSAPLVVTGDFNAIAHESPAHATLLGAGLVDTWDAARSRGPAYGTWHGWGAPAPGGDRIDWILATPDVTVLRAWVDLSADGGQWPSDHFPVCASLRLPAAPE